MLRKKKKLSEVKTGTDFFINEIQSSPEICLRLRELGFTENAVIRNIVNGSSQLICEVHNTRIGIHHRIAKDIIVSSEN
ncbi:MAG: FeoA domain-containing protein [Ignavibacteriales bacterium]|nr:FeoA domain-containing protein [Ignavibacteriales bacterium]